MFFSNKKKIDIYFMLKALNEAKKAIKVKEIPVGVVIIDKNNKIISKSFNESKISFCSINHAEISAIKKACIYLKSYYLNNCTLYTTLEPCIMCSGAILYSKIKRVVFGAYDKKNNFFRISNLIFLLNNNKNFNLPIIKGGVMKKKCSLFLKNFFKNKR